MRMAAWMAMALMAAFYAGPALAEDEWKADKASCAGAYGALADQTASMTGWNANLARSNLGAIDWAARKAKVINGSPVIEEASSFYETNFKMMIIKDRIDGGAKGSATVLQLSIRCDAALGNTPAFALPPKTNP